MSILENSTEFERKLARLTRKVKLFRKAGGTKKGRLPPKLWLEAVVVARLTSISEVASRLGVSRSSLHLKLKAQSTDKQGPWKKKRKSRPEFLEITPLLKEAQRGPMDQGFDNSREAHRTIREVASFNSELCVDVIRPDGVAMKIHGNSLQMNLINLVGQFIGGNI